MSPAKRVTLSRASRACPGLDPGAHAAPLSHGWVCGSGRPRVSQWLIRGNEISALRPAWALNQVQGRFPDLPRLLASAVRGYEQRRFVGSGLWLMVGTLAAAKLRLRLRYGMDPGSRLPICSLVRGYVAGFEKTKVVRVPGQGHEVPASRGPCRAQNPRLSLWLQYPFLSTLIIILTGSNKSRLGFSPSMDPGSRRQGTASSGNTDKGGLWKVASGLREVGQ